MLLCVQTNCHIKLKGNKMQMACVPVAKKKKKLSLPSTRISCRTFTPNDAFETRRKNKRAEMLSLK